MENKILRIIDANYNRAREGLRTVEDILRFFYNNEKFAKEFKNIRQNFSREIAKIAYFKLLEARDVKKDPIKLKEYRIKVASITRLLRMNFQRVTESLRVIEEMMRIIKPGSKKKFSSLRFKVYGLEKEFFTLLDSKHLRGEIKSK
jgi:thiamine-phosphate pyrophosphorylase